MGKSQSAAAVVWWGNNVMRLSLPFACSSAGDRVDFFSAPGRSKSYSFQILEETVVQFLRSFHELFGQVRTPYISPGSQSQNTSLYKTATGRVVC